TAEAPDVDRAKLKRPSGRWVASQESARVGAAVRQAGHDGARFCAEQVVDGRVQIRASIRGAKYALFVRRTSTHLPEKCTVQHEVRGHAFVEDVEVTPVRHLLCESSSNGLSSSRPGFVPTRSTPTPNQSAPPITRLE